MGKIFGWQHLSKTMVNIAAYGLCRELKKIQTPNFGVSIPHNYS